jgi:hypothetical protein
MQRSWAPISVFKLPEEVTLGKANCDGPMLVPKMVIISPGATGPARRLALFTTPPAKNCAGSNLRTT